MWPRGKADFALSGDPVAVRDRCFLLLGWGGGDVGDAGGAPWSGGSERWDFLAEV